MAARCSRSCRTTSPRAIGSSRWWAMRTAGSLKLLPDQITGRGDPIRSGNTSLPRATGSMASGSKPKTSSCTLRRLNSSRHTQSRRTTPPGSGNVPHGDSCARAARTGARSRRSISSAPSSYGTDSGCRAPDAPTPSEPSGGAQVPARDAGASAADGDFEEAPPAVGGAAQSVWWTRRRARGHRFNAWRSTPAATSFSPVESGSGKRHSSPNRIQLLRRRQEHVCYHFIGRCQSNGRTRASRLRNLCQQLASYHELAGELPADKEQLRILYADLFETSAAQQRRASSSRARRARRGGRIDPGLRHVPARTAAGVFVVFSARGIADRNWLT